MVTLTSASANKHIKLLTEQKNTLLVKERTASFYRAFQNEEPVVPEYDFDDLHVAIADIDFKIRKIKHALNIFNCSTIVPETNMTIDETLVYMAQLTARKVVLSTMATVAPKERVDSFRNTSPVAEYKYANFDCKRVADIHKNVAEKIAKIQISLDTVNQTQTFEVDIDL